MARLVDEPDGLERVLLSVAIQRAGKLALRTTNRWLLSYVATPSLKKSRDLQLASYNDYREHMGFARVTRFDHITVDVTMQRKLRDVLVCPDNIEYCPGIFAEDKDLGSVHGPFLATIGTAMTFLAIHSSRLFETDRVNEESLTKRGMEFARYEQEAEQAGKPMRANSASRKAVESARTTERNCVPRWTNVSSTTRLNHADSLFFIKIYVFRISRNTTLPAHRLRTANHAHLSQPRPPPPSLKSPRPPLARPAQLAS